MPSPLDEANRSAGAREYAARARRRRTGALAVGAAAVVVAAIAVVASILEPNSRNAALFAPESGVMSASTLIQHALSDVVLAKASVCLYDTRT